MDERWWRLIAGWGFSAVCFVGVWLCVGSTYAYASDAGFVLFGVGVLAFGGGIAMAARSTVLRVLALVLTGGPVACVALFLGVLILAFGPTDDDKVAHRSVTPDGQVELVVIDINWIDLEGEVLLRSGYGLFAREATVWYGVEGRAPKDARLTGPRSVEVVTESGCHFRARFDPGTLRVEPSHKERPQPAC